MNPAIKDRALYGATTILDPIFPLWHKLQSGQEKIIRFGRYLPKFGEQMRHQNGHEHRCSVFALFTCAMITANERGAKLDELLLTRCISVHDEPEGVTGIDLPAFAKTDNDDLREYLVFEALYKPQGAAVWMEMREAFLLQFCLDNPACFPDDARGVMRRLAVAKRREALFFQAIQKLDYLYYGYECWIERGISRILYDVVRNQADAITKISLIMPEIAETVWTPDRQAFFRVFLRSVTPEDFDVLKS